MYKHNWQVHQKPRTKIITLDGYWPFQWNDKDRTDEKYVGAEVAGHFVKSCVFNHVPLLEHIEENHDCFTSKFFIDLCKLSSIQNSFKTKY